MGNKALYKVVDTKSRSREFSRGALVRPEYTSTHESLDTIWVCMEDVVDLKHSQTDADKRGVASCDGWHCVFVKQNYTQCFFGQYICMKDVTQDGQ